MAVLNQQRRKKPNQATLATEAIGGFSTAQPESRTTLPWGISPQNSWLDYRCWIETELDPGMVLHKPLPQTNPKIDTLALISAQDPQLDIKKPLHGGVNLRSFSSAVDAVQRMASSTYRFVLRGLAVRAGYQVPIPGIVAIAGRTPTPVFPQRATNMIIGNFNGVPIWYAIWELHYVITRSPSNDNAELPVPYNPALHIRPDQTLPDNIPLPFANADQEHLAQVAAIGQGVGQ